MTDQYVTKHGLIFSSQTMLSGTGLEFAQSPQAVVFDNFIRVFFTSRYRDDDQWVSIPMSVDFDSELMAPISDARRVEFSKSVTGGFDEHGIFPFSPLKVGELLYSFTTGWRRMKSVPVETAIGLMISSDGGISFERHGTGPIVNRSLMEPFLVCDAQVVDWNSQFHMFYLFGTKWTDDPRTGAPERTYKIGHLVSDSIDQWPIGTGTPIIPEIIPLEAQALPSVSPNADGLEMVFCFRKSTDFRQGGPGSYDLGYASSIDGESWTRNDFFVKWGRTKFDSEMRCYPSFLDLANRRVVLYNGNSFGRFGFGMVSLWR